MSDTPYMLMFYPNSYTEYELPKELFPLFEEKAYLMGDKEKAGAIEIRCHDCTVEIND